MSLLTKPARIAEIVGLTLFLVPIFGFEKLTRSASAALNRTQPDADVAMLPDLTLSTTVLICLPCLLDGPATFTWWDGHHAGQRCAGRNAASRPRTRSSSG